MIDEAKAKELLRLLRLIDAEQRAAKADAKKHKETIDELLDQVLEVRGELEGEVGPTLFDEPALMADEPTMEALAADPPTPEPPAAERESKPGIDPYEQGAQARRDGVPSTACPYEEGSYHGVSWMNGWTELEDLPDDESEEPEL